MKRELELFFAGLLAALSWFINHYVAIMGAILVTISVFVWALKLRREWKHRNDQPEND
jgi:hypothetical protein